MSRRVRVGVTSAWVPLISWEGRSKHNIGYQAFLGPLLAPSASLRWRGGLPRIVDARTFSKSSSQPLEVVLQVLLAPLRGLLPRFALAFLPRFALTCAQEPIPLALQTFSLGLLKLFLALVALGAGNLGAAATAAAAAPPAAGAATAGRREGFGDICSMQAHSGCCIQLDGGAAASLLGKELASLWEVDS